VKEKTHSENPVQKGPAMKKTTIVTIPSTTIGLDLSDRTFQFCELNAAGEIVDEGQLRLNRATVLGYLTAKPPARVWRWRHADTRHGFAK
jgi:hypothetical protein